MSSVCDEGEIINMDTYLFSEETGIFPAAWLSPGGFWKKAASEPKCQ